MLRAVKMVRQQLLSRSALGHKRTFAMQKGMSALHPKADICGTTWDVRFGPKVKVKTFYSSVGFPPKAASHQETHK